MWPNKQYIVTFKTIAMPNLDIPTKAMHNSHGWLQCASHTMSRLGIATVLELTVHDM